MSREPFTKEVTQVIIIYTEVNCSLIKFKVNMLYKLSRMLCA